MYRYFSRPSIRFDRNAFDSIVGPFTTSLDDELSPLEGLVPAEEGPLREDATALCNQIRTVSIEGRITEVAGSIAEDLLDGVDEAVEYSLGHRPVREW